jgi:predicted TIM-barrel fold metal-dependent hydrolase
MTAVGTDLLLPDPEPREVRYTVISVDDHVVEPPHTFAGRLPAALAERAPRIVELDGGQQVWEFEGEKFTQVGMNAVAGRRPETWSEEPFRFDHMRAGCYDIDARLRDMDTNGVWASVNFPSRITGFCGTVFFNTADRALGLACIRAWNDWLYEEWFDPHRERIVPMGITYLADPELAVAEIVRNADRGFVAVTFPERPHLIGLPSLWDRKHWDPIMRACVDTGTVICLHVGSSGVDLGVPPDGDRYHVHTTLFSQLSLTACAEWLWSGYPLRHPDLRIAMSEGGIGWVPLLLDRLDYITDRSHQGYDYDPVAHKLLLDRPPAMRPSELVRRNFWFCTFGDPRSIVLREQIGLDHIMVEVDYPHADSTWPDTQQVIAESWGHLPAADLRALCCENAAALFRHPLPPVVLP